MLRLHDTWTLREAQGGNRLGAVATSGTPGSPHLGPHPHTAGARRGCLWREGLLPPPDGQGPLLPSAWWCGLYGLHLLPSSAWLSRGLPVLWPPQEGHRHAPLGTNKRLHGRRPAGKTAGSRRSAPGQPPKRAGQTGGNRAPAAPPPGLGPPGPAPPTGPRPPGPAPPALGLQAPPFLPRGRQLDRRPPLAALVEERWASHDELESHCHAP